MPLIEGFGDEVLIVVAVLLIALLLSLAWMSTRVADSVPISVIILDRTSRIFQRVGSRVTPSISQQRHTDGSGRGGSSAVTSENNTRNASESDDDQEEGEGEEDGEGVRVGEGVDRTANQCSAASDDESSLTAGCRSSTAAAAGCRQQSAAADDESSCCAAASELAAATNAAATAAGECQELTSRRQSLHGASGPSSCRGPQAAGLGGPQNHTAAGLVDPEQRTAAGLVDPEQRTAAGLRVPEQRTAAGLRDPEQRTAGGWDSSEVDPERVGAERVGESTGKLMNISLQFVDGRRTTVQTSPDRTIGGFKRDHFSTQLDGDSLIRFVMNGQELRDDSLPLSSYNITEGSIIHCLVTHRPVSHPHTTPMGGTYAQVGGLFDVGRLMWPLFGSILVLLWYARITYRGFFNAMSTFCLIAISFFFVIGLLASLRTANQSSSAAGATRTQASSGSSRPHQD